LLAELVTEIEPVKLPVACGWNNTGTRLLVPAGTVNGVCILALKPVPVTATPETLTSTALAFVSVRFLEELLPTITFPKEIDEGDSVSVGTDWETPVP